MSTRTIEELLKTLNNEQLIQNYNKVKDSPEAGTPRWLRIMEAYKSEMKCRNIHDK